MITAQLCRLSEGTNWSMTWSSGAAAERKGQNKSIPYWRAVLLWAVVNGAVAWQCVMEAIHALKISGAEKFLVSEFLLQSWKYIFNFSFVLCLQNKSILLAVWGFIPEVNKRKEKKCYSFWKAWPQVYRGKKTLKFWLLNSKLPERSQLRAWTYPGWSFPAEPFWLYFLCHGAFVLLDCSGLQPTARKALSHCICFA